MSNERIGRIQSVQLAEVDRFRREIAPTLSRQQLESLAVAQAIAIYELRNANEWFLKQGAVKVES